MHNGQFNSKALPRLSTALSVMEIQNVSSVHFPSRLPDTAVFFSVVVVVVVVPRLTAPQVEKKNCDINTDGLNALQHILCIHSAFDGSVLYSTN